MDTKELRAKLESYAGQFLQTREQLLAAQKVLGSKATTASTMGYAVFGNNKFTLAEIQALQAENNTLLRERDDLEKRLLDLKKQFDSFTGGEEGFPVIDGIAGLDAGLFSVAAWVAAATILIGSIVYFMSRVKSFLGKVATGAADTAFEIGKWALILGGGFLLIKALSGGKDN